MRKPQPSNAYVTHCSDCIILLIWGQLLRVIIPRKFNLGSARKCCSLRKKCLILILMAK